MTTTTPSGDDRPPRYEEETLDGETIVVYRASGLGTCPRALVAYARGHVPAPTPEWMQEVFNEGHRAEPLIRAEYERIAEVTVVGDQYPVELDLGDIEGNRVVVRGHVDGMFDAGHDRVLFEAKKFRASTWTKFQQQGIECNVNYPWQVAAYMHALECERAAFVGGKIHVDDDGVLHLDGIEVKHIEQPPFSIAAIRKRIVNVERQIAKGFVPPEVACNKAMFPCPFYKLHDDDTKDTDAFAFDGEEREVVDVLMASYAQVCGEVRAAEEESKRHTERKRRLADAIRELVDARAATATHIEGTEFVLTRVRKTIPAHQRKESTQDYFTIKERTS